MNPIEAIRASIRDMVLEALEQARAQSMLSFDLVPDFVIEVPREKGHGDFACNIAMLLAKQARKSPRDIAQMILAQIRRERYPLLADIEVAGAGFLNIFLKPDWLYDVPAMVVRLGSNFGRGSRLNQRVQVEFVSANPTGNLHMGNARGGAIGDSLANILTFAGYDVEREFYINDAGNQIEIFADSLDARYLQLTGHDIQFPENGYAGQDVVDTVKGIMAACGDGLARMNPVDRRQWLVSTALRDKIAYIRKTLESFGIQYDQWFSEQVLHQSGQVSQVLEELKQKGFIYEKDDALWFKTTAFGDEKDEVVVRANGVPTYFAADIAYHKDKFDRGFDWVIDIWGADHHGHVSRMKGAMSAMGYDPARLDVILMQLVHLYRGGNIVRMSKRTGTTVSLDELMEEVGKDAARFLFVMRSPDSHLDFDMELAKQQSQENPVYYVQYAHARICSIFRQAATSGITMPPVEQINGCLLQAPEEQAMLRKIVDFPEEIAVSARTLSPQRIARYALDLAGQFHSYYNHYRVLNEDDQLQAARLLLMDITRTTIRNALTILGVNAPEQM